MNLVMPGMELSDNAAESSRQASADGSDQQLVSGLYSDYEQMMYRIAFNILRSRTQRTPFRRLLSGSWEILKKFVRCPATKGGSI